MAERLDPAKIKSQVDSEAEALLGEESLTSFGKPKQGASVVGSGEQKGDAQRKNLDFKKIKEIDEIRKAIGSVYNKNNEGQKLQKKIKPEDFRNEIINRFITYTKAIKEDGTIADTKKGEVGIKIKDIIENPKSHYKTLEAAIKRAAVKKAGEILGEKKESKTEEAKKPEEILKIEEKKLKKPDKAAEEEPKDVDYKVGVANAKSFEELLEVFNPDVEITKTKKNYNTEEIVDIITKIRKREIGLENVPKGLGLEKKLEELLLAEKEKKEEEDKETAEKKEAARIERHGKIEEIRAKVAEARREWLEVDYKKNTALSRIRKYFSNKDTDDFYFAKDRDKDKARMRSYESDIEIAAFRADYDNKLFDLQKLLIEDAKERGASNEELANLYIEFQTEQKITVADDHDKVKAEYLYNLENKQKEGEEEKSKLGQWKEKGERGYYKSKNFLKEKTVGITKWYQALSPATKIAIGVAFMGTGAGLAFAGVGAAAGTAFAGVVTARRFFGGMTAGIGTALTLEAKGQKKDREKIEVGKQEFLEKLNAFGQMTEEEKNVFLQNDKNKEYILKDGDGFESQEEKIKYLMLEDDIKNIAIKDKDNSINKIKNQDLKQLATGTAVGFGVIAGSFFAADIFKGVKGISHSVIEHFSGGNQIAAGGIGGAGVVGAIENVHGVHAPINPVENLTVEKGSSFEGTIKNFLDTHREEFLKTHPELTKFNDGQIAHRLATEYMNTHPEMEGHLPDYIHEGSKLDFNPTTMQVEINDPQGHGWYETTHSGGNASGMETPETPSDVPSDGALEQPITAEDTVMHQDLENYVQSETGKMESFSNALDGNTDIHNGALGMIDADHAFAQSELHNLLIEKNVLSSPDFHERVGAFRKMFFNDKISIFNKLKDVKVSDIFNGESGHGINELPNTESRKMFKQMLKEFPLNATNKEETMGRWTLRIIRSFNKTN